MGRGPGVRAVGNGIQVDFRWKGQRCRERLALRPTAVNLRYAANLKARIEHEIAKGEFDYEKHFPRSRKARRLAQASAGMRLSKAIEVYLATLRGQVEPESLAKYERDGASIAAALGDPPIEELTRTRVRTWLAAQTLSRKRLNNLMIPLRGALDQAEEDEAIERNPLQGFKLRRSGGSPDSIDPFTPEEVAALASTELGDTWLTWAWTGLRSGELIGLERADVDLAGGALYVRRAVRVGREKAPKTQSGVRTVTLLPPAKTALERTLAAHKGSSVFTNPNTGVRWHEDRGLARAFKKACEAASVRYRYPYQLRHTYATWALSAGENPAWIARQMGHSDTLMLFRVYGKWMPRLDPKAGSKMLQAAQNSEASGRHFLAGSKARGGHEAA